MRWQDLTAPEFAGLDRERTVVVLPLGSIEQPAATCRSAPTPCSPRDAVAGGGGRVRRRADAIVCRRPGTASRRITCAFRARVTLRAETLMPLVDDIAGA